MNPNHVAALLICFGLFIAIAFLLALERRKQWKGLDKEDEQKKECERIIMKNIAMRHND